MKNLVLGSSGQIGKELTNYLRNQNQTVFEFDIYNSKYEDLRIHNNILLQKLLYESDFVYFLAFDVGGSTYLKKYQHTFDFIDNNIKLMAETFTHLEKYKTPFIFASSQMSNMSFSPYGILKAVGETYTKSLNGLIVKFWNVYGIEHDLEKTHVITDFILQAKHVHKINMLTDGEEERQMLYTEDCCKCLKILSEKYNDISRTEQLHITNFEWTKIIDIAKIISKTFNNVPIFPALTKDTVQQGYRNEPSTDILKYWKAETSLEDGIKKLLMV